MRHGMLSVLIETRNDEEGLARTLASLVGGAVEGVVRDVIVCDAGSTDGTRRVADHAGCHVAADLATGIAGARGGWLLMLEPGARLAEGWVDEAVAHMAKFEMPARFSRARGSRAPFLSRAFRRPGALLQGLLIRKQQAASLAHKAKSAEALARGLAMRTLAADIWPARQG
jgi:glycosyltransferase involved in cell wall biosynthesis